MLSDVLHYGDRQDETCLEAFCLGDAEIDSVNEIRRNIDLECLADRAPLVGDADDDALAVRGRDGCQREHVSSDDVRFEFIDVEITAGVAPGGSRVGEAVDPVLGIRVVPVVKEIIVKERTSDKAVLIETDLESSLEEMSHKETILRN